MTGSDGPGRVFEISEAELDAILEHARDRAEAVKRGTLNHTDDRFAAGLREGAEQLHRGVIERGDLVDDATE